MLLKPVLNRLTVTCLCTPPCLAPCDVTGTACLDILYPWQGSVKLCQSGPPVWTPSDLHIKEEGGKDGIKWGHRKQGQRGWVGPFCMFPTPFCMFPNQVWGLSLHRPGSMVLGSRQYQGLLSPAAADSSSSPCRGLSTMMPVFALWS